MSKDKNIIKGCAEYVDENNIKCRSIGGGVMRKRGSEYQSCGCETHFYFEPFEVYEQELCGFHQRKLDNASV